MELPELTDAAQVQALLSNEQYVDRFTLAYIQLCIVAYQTDPTKIAQIPKNIADPKMVTPLTGCRWVCNWGPVYDYDESNLAVIATAVRISDNTPLLNVVVIRGTDLIEKAFKYHDLGDFVQLVEDLGVGTQVRVPWLPFNSTERIAKGTHWGFEIVAGFKGAGNATIRDYLAGTLSGPPQSRPAIIITGHSLGGCVTSVVAPWLADSFKNMVPQPHVAATTFAGPTAGNPDYARYVTATVDSFSRYCNTLDFAPNWWSNLEGNNSIYLPYGLRTPDWLVDADNILRDIIPVYGQPETTRPIKGIFAKDLSWYGEAAHQHHAATYLALLTGKTPPVDANCETGDVA